MKRSRRVFVSDCEGPISKNDNAFEIASHFLPKGGYLFSLLSKYDDVIADLIKRPGYRAGYTLTLITPFFKAYGVTNRKIEEFSAKNILLIRGAEEMLRWIEEAMPSFIVSTSYEQYMISLCSMIGFPYRNVYCTKLDLDKTIINSMEADRLKQLEKEISTHPMIEIPKDAKSIIHLSETSQATVRRLDTIFWEELVSMKVGKLLEDIKPIGGAEKANSVTEIAKSIGSDLHDVMYVGDSITDVEAFQLLRKCRGLTVSFNGNEYAVRNAEIVVLSENAIVTSVLAEVFSNFGREAVLKLVKEWDYSALKKYCSERRLIQAVIKAFPENLPIVEIVTQDNLNRLIEESANFRKTVRGQVIGTLG